MSGEMILTPGRSYDGCASALAGDTRGAWATIGDGELVLRAGEQALEAIELPFDAVGPLAVSERAIDVGAQRFDRATGAWVPPPDRAALLAAIVAAHPEHAGADPAQLAIPQGAWAGDRRIVHVELRPSRTGRRTGPGPCDWLFAIDGADLELLATGAPTPHGGLATTTDAVAACFATGARVWRGRDARTLVTADARSCAFAAGGAFVAVALQTGAVRAWHRLDDVPGLGEHGPRADVLLGHPRLPLLAWQAERTLHVADLARAVRGRVDLSPDARLIGWDAARATLFVADGNESFAAWEL